MQKKGINMLANDLDKKVMSRMSQFDIEPIMGFFELVGAGQQAEVRNITGQSNQYYQWLACLCQEIHPKQIVELGAAAGISTIMFSLFAPDSKIYSVDNDPEAWRWMKSGHDNVTKILDDDLDMKIWKDVDLKETDLWFFDTLHTEEQLRKELALYTPYFKKGTVVVLDDIRFHDGMKRVWDDITFDKCENTNPCHYSGFGFFVV